MSLAAYQELFCRMVASPALRDRFLQTPDEVCRHLDLTDRERKRLESIVHQPGMRVNTAIHRANRLTPLYQTLPFTCFLLGEGLRETLERYWTLHPSENLQLDVECERFADYLIGELRAGRVWGEYLEEVLAFERNCAALRFRQPPLLRIIPFRHDPEPLLASLARLELPTPPPATGDFQLAVDCRHGEADFYLLDPTATAALQKNM